MFTFLLYSLRQKNGNHCCQFFVVKYTVMCNCVYICTVFFTSKFWQPRMPVFVVKNMVMCECIYICKVMSIPATIVASFAKKTSSVIKKSHLNKNIIAIISFYCLTQFLYTAFQWTVSNFQMYHLKNLKTKKMPTL